MPVVASYTIPAEAPSPSISGSGGEGGTLALIPDYCADGLALLIGQYKDKPRIAAWLCSFLRRAQNLEQAIVDVYTKGFDLDTAKGVQLDLIGRLVREARAARSDDEYRRSLRVRVLVNRSQGTIPELIAIARLFEDFDSEAGSFVRIQGVQPARLEVRVVRTPVNSPVEVDKRLRQAKAAGVALQTLIHPGGPSRSFRFCSVADYPEKSTTEGFADSGGGVTGGAWAHVLD